MISRRQFLRGDLSGRKPPLRPPWARSEAEFLKVCTGCNACVTACPEKILVDVRRYPEIRFAQGECTFCGECLAVCTPGALKKTNEQPPWNIRAKIGTQAGASGESGSCIAYRGIVCRSCGDACGETAIRFSLRADGLAFPEISSDRCTGCGACVSACPVDAVSMTSSDGKGGDSQKIIS